MIEIRRREHWAEAFSRQVLIVDADPQDRRQLADEIRRWGYPVLTAATGMDGLALIEEERPAIVMWDRHLSDITGQQILERIRQSTALRDMAVILTGRCTDEELHRAWMFNPDHQASKPLALREVGYFINRLLRGKHPSEERSA